MAYRTTRIIRSRLATDVFNLTSNLDEVLQNLLEKPLADVGSQPRSVSRCFRTTIAEDPSTDGFRDERSGYHYGSSMPSGQRIVDFNAFRTLCSLLDLEGSRRLKGEPSLPTEAELREMLLHQVPEVELLEPEKFGLEIYRADQLRVLTDVAIGV